MDEILKQLQELKNLTVLSAKQALTMSDTAILTGLSKSHLYKLVCAKKIPYYKSQGGKLTYFDKGEVNSWMLQHKVKTSDELETAATNYLVTGKGKKGGKK
jgi:excisionase family DNA binding protein